MSRWFRYYDEALNDPKVQTLPGELFKTWVNLMCVASKYEGTLPAAETVAFLLRRDIDAVRRDLAELAARILLDETAAGLAPHNWNVRQYKSDVSTARVREHRRRGNGPDADSETVQPLAHGRSPLLRHARPCAGHPRLPGRQDVDGRDKPGHDKERAGHDDSDRNAWAPVPETASDSESDPDSEQKQIQNQRSSGTRSREELDQLEAWLRAAAGQGENPSPGLCDLSPILGLLDAGHSLAEDILPTIRARAGNGFKPASWAYYVKPVKEARARRLGIAGEKAAGAIETRAEKEARWKKVLARLEAERPWPYRYPSEIPAAFVERFRGNNPRPACGERVPSELASEAGEGAPVHAPHPAFSLRSKADLSPRSGERQEETP